MRLFFTLFLVLILGSETLSAADAEGWLGIAFRETTAKEAKALGWAAPRGVVIDAVWPDSAASKAGLRKDDVVVSLDGQEIADPDGYKAVSKGKAAGTKVTLRVMRARRELIVTAILGTMAPELTAQKAATEGPQLMLDSGGHTAKVGKVLFTPDGRQLVSASDDKTIRVWDIETGRTTRIIRGQVWPDSTGKIYSIALSPDGRWLAAGGWMSPDCEGRCGDIRLYDFASGTLAALLQGHTNVVFGLAFSADSKRLISASADKTGAIWDVEKRQRLVQLKGHTDILMAASFLPGSTRAVTASFDGTLRLWDTATGRLVTRMTGHGDKVRALAISPADGTIFSGDEKGDILTWDGKTGKRLRTFGGQGSAIGSLTFSPDGSRLISTRAQLGQLPQTLWDVASGSDALIYTKHDNIVVASAYSPDGRMAVTAGGENAEIHFWDPATGKTLKRFKGQGATVRAVAFSADGSSIAWGQTLDPSPDVPLNRHPLEYRFRLPLDGAAMTGPEQLDEPPAEGTFVRDAATHGKWTLGTLLGSFMKILEIKEDGRVKASIARGEDSGRRHTAYTFTPDGQTVVSGGSFGVLAAYDLKGGELGNFIGHTGDITAIATSPDGRFLLSGAADQTVRLWNLKTRELLMTLYFAEGGEWVAWAPQGYYAASGPGAEMVGWQINHGWDKDPGYVNAAQLRKRLNRPDIIARGLQKGSMQTVVTEASGSGFKVADLMKQPVPRIRITPPSPGTAFRGGKADVSIALQPTPDPVRVIRFQVNGRQIAEHIPSEGSGFSPGDLTFSVPLAKGNNTVRAIAVNEMGETADTVLVDHEGPGDLDRRGTLYVIAAGVDKYPNLGKACLELDGKTPKSCDLNVAGADATAFAAAMEKQLGATHERVVTRVLAAGGAPRDVPTAANILDALGTLRTATENDTVAIFLSGHGVNDGPYYRFLATDAAFDGGTLRNSTVVPWANVQEALEAAKGRRFLFVDTCHAGNSYNQRLANDSYQANIIVYSAARWDQEALERGDLGHGLFTYAVVEGMNGKADLRQTREVRAEDLRDYLRQRVGALAKEMKRRQEPQYFRGRDAENYLLVRLQ